MKIHFIVLFGVVLVLAFAVWAWFGNLSEREIAVAVPAQPELVTADPQRSALPTIVSEGGPVVESLSISLFAQRDFVGGNFTVGRTLSEQASYTRHYITYQSNGLTISGIMNVPRGDGPFPLLVLNHGYIDPAVYTNGRGLKREQDYLARRGYVVVHPDYRNHADSDDDATADRQFRFGYAEDVINVIGALEEVDLPYVDTERVGMLGHSMGGGIAWRVAVTQPSLVDAYVQFAPVSADERDNFETWIRRRAETAQAILSEHGEPAANPDFWDGISPLTFFAQVAVPIMIHHGAADESVPLDWSERAAGELEALGKDVTLHVYPGEPHEFIDAWSQVMARTVAFFDQHVKNNS